MGRRAAEGAAGQARGSTSDGSDGSSCDGGKGSGQHRRRQIERDSGTDTPARDVPCGGANTKVTAQTVSHPVDHTLLTVANTRSTICDLHPYAAVNFGESRPCRR
ncbi:hypothetical protein [Streptomyces sp. NPDC050528]|uniref:hypothetical protein n=1 Tax=unclassified Streptomyces TaxID=2593676 RepID=UPI0037A5D581